MKPLRILIVEDSEPYAAMLAEFLPGCERITVGTLAEAKRHLDANHFDAIIADLHLPDSGPEMTLAEINLRAGDAAVIATSGRSTGMPGNCDAAFHKVNVQTPDDLLQIVHIAFERKSAKSRLERKATALDKYVRCLTLQPA